MIRIEYNSLNSDLSNELCTLLQEIRCLANTNLCLPGSQRRLNSILKHRGINIFGETEVVTYFVVFERMAVALHWPKDG